MDKPYRHNDERKKVDTGYLLYGSTIVSTVKVRTVITLGDERQQCT